MITTPPSCQLRFLMHASAFRRTCVPAVLAVLAVNTTSSVTEFAYSYGASTTQPLLHLVAVCSTPLGCLTCTTAVVNPPSCFVARSQVTRPESAIASAGECSRAGCALATYWHPSSHIGKCRAVRPGVVQHVRCRAFRSDRPHSDIASGGIGGAAAAGRAGCAEASSKGGASSGEADLCRTEQGRCRTGTRAAGARGAACGGVGWVFLLADCSSMGMDTGSDTEGFTCRKRHAFPLHLASLVLNMAGLAVRGPGACDM